MHKFRSDIQGLRAIAVLPVLLFHFGIGLLPGGFVGVDVFFVISGFVITIGLIETLAAGTFTFSGFYLRRVRRIVPALLLTCSVTAVVAWFSLLPFDFANFGRSLIAVLLSISNFYFWKSSGYFAPESHSAPLLHCWSLAVEEQFYLFMPLMMVLVARWLKGRWLWLILPVLTISLAICVVMAVLAPSGGFYLLPSRAWELMAGAAVAAIVIRQSRNPKPSRPWVREVCATIGLGLIAWSMLTLHESDVFPGWNAIPPVFGSALVIWSGGGSTRPQVTALLSVSPLTQIGTISYSLYLVHWPIAAIVFYRLLRAPTVIEAVAMLALSLVLAAASYSLVELPLRKRGRRSHYELWALGALLFCGLFGFGELIVRQNGMPERYPAFTMIDLNASKEYGGSHCFNDIVSRPIDWDDRLCSRTQGSRHRVLLWGDSFAAHYVPGLMRDAAARNATILQYTTVGCPPIQAFRGLGQLACVEANAKVPDLIRTEHVDTVVLSARWTNLEGNMLGRLHETIATLRQLGVQVFVIGQSPEFAADPQRIDYLSGQTNAPDGSWQISFDPGIEARLAAESRDATFIDPLPALCRGNVCPYRQGKTWLFYDDGHFSAAGSLDAVQRYFPLANRTIAAPNGATPR